MIEHRTALIAIFAISFGLIVEEIMLSAIFHVLLGAGNTVAAISIALVGLSASGLLAYTLPDFHRPERSAALVGTLLFWFAICIMASAYLIMAVPISHGDLIYHRDDLSVQFWRLAVYHITVIPFFVGGLAIAVLFRSDPPRIGRLYFADLAGAALGCVVSPVLLGSVGAPGAIIAAGVPVAAMATASALRARSRLRFWAWLPALLLLVAPLRPALMSFSTLNTMGMVEDSKYQSFPIAWGDIEYERWALDAWTIIRSDRIPQQWQEFKGWGLSDRYDGPIPDFKLINYNARFSTYVTRPGADDEAFAEWLDADLSSLHHLIGRQFDAVLNIGAGGGREVLSALQHGAARVVAVDVSEVVVEDLMKDRLREFSGELYFDPRVEAIADEGRTFAERSVERFDLIEFSIVGGMNLEKMDLVRVDDLFTLEALETYLSRLREDGVFSYGMYTTRSDIVSELARGDGTSAHPYIPALRTLTGLRQALEALDPEARFADHVLVAALPKHINPRYDLVHIIVSLRPFSTEERVRFLARCNALNFVPLHPRPAGQASNLYAEVATTGDLPAFADSLPFSVWPATDDRPFHYSLDVSHLRRAFEEGELWSLLSGNPLISLGMSIGSLAAILTLIPLWVTARRDGGLRLLRSSWSLLLYFACIGFAYMAVEIAALLRLQSYLGKPIYGLSVGLFAFLLSSGLGSGFTSRFDPKRLERSVHLIVGVLIAMGLVFIAGSGMLFDATIAAPLPVRMAVAVAAIFPLAFPMGMLFPLGAQLISRESENLIPWAWATNGCFSVLGIFGTRVTAIFLGFSRALLLGLFAYALVSGFVWIHTRLRLRTRGVAP